MSRANESAVDDILAGLARDRRGLHARLERIADAHGTTSRAILGRSQETHVKAARVDWYTCLRARGMSYPEIGRASNRDHTSVREVLTHRERTRKAQIKPSHTVTPPIRFSACEQCGGWIVSLVIGGGRPVTICGSDCRLHRRKVRMWQREEGAAAE